MVRFLLGVAVGMAAATALHRQGDSRPRRPGSGEEGRVDEFSSAIEHPPTPVDVEAVDAGDATPASRHDAPSQSDEGRRAEPVRTESALGSSSDSFNAA